MLFVLVEFQPIFLREQCGHIGGRERKIEGLASAKRFFQVRQRKAGIDGEKGPFGNGGFRGGLWTAALAQAVAEDGEQRFCIVATGNANHAFRAGELDQFPGLFEVTPEKDQKLGGPAVLETLHHHIARKKRQHFFRSDVLADPGHAQEGAKRARNRDVGRRCGRLASGLSRGSQPWSFLTERKGVHPRPPVPGKELRKEL